MLPRPQPSKPQRASEPVAARDGPSLPVRAVLAAVVLAAALLPVWKSIGFELVWDDLFLIGPNLDVRGPADIARIWRTPFDVLLKEDGGTRTYFRPATLLSLSADRALWREDPRGFHAQNLFWYGLTCFFLWLLAWEISGRPLAATAGTVLFALHPTHPESVCFVSGRTDLLAGAFLFASLWTAARYGPRIRSSWLKLVPASLILLPGIYAKEVALFGAPLLPIALWLKDRKIGAPALARSCAGVGMAVLLYLGTRISTLGPAEIPAIAPVEGVRAQILTSVAVVARYAALLFVPVALSARHEVEPTRTPDLIFVAGLVLIFALALGVVAAWRRRSPWLLPLALLAGTLLPVCIVRFLSGAIVAERFLFVPSAAIALSIALLPGARIPRASGKGQGQGKMPRSAAVPPGDAGLGFLAACGVGAIWLLTLLVPRVAVWRDEGTLFTSMLRESPQSPHVHGIIGGYYYRHRDLERAAEHYRRSFELYPKSGEMLLNLVAAEDELGRTDSAFVHTRTLIAMQPRYGPAWYALGNLYVRIDRPDSARMAYERAIREMPDLAQAENNLGVVLERMGRNEEALAHYRRAGEILPGYPEAARNWNRLHAQLAKHPMKGPAR
jgi:protein O-mannosyl-transferase